MVSTTSRAGSKKRRFQPPQVKNPITNYFSSADSQSESPSSSDVSYHNYSAPTFSPSPALPNRVQASLLTVGMRVRKAVPEGYQTVTKNSKLDAYIHRAMDIPSGAETETNTTTAPAELMPFCGMFKVGNLAVQSFPHPTRSEHGATVGLDDNSLPSSQESTDSVSSIPTVNPHNRGLDSDSDCEEEYNMVSPFPHQPGLWRENYTEQGPLSSRTILTPRVGQKGRRAVFKFSKTTGKGENQSHLSSSVMDFEEAVFLRRREEVDDDYKEIDMGGV